MNDTIQIICENLGEKLTIPMGTPLQEVAEDLTPGAHPFLAAFVNNRIRELNYRLYTPATVRFVDITSFAGIRVYQRTVWFLLQKAVKDLYPGRRSISGTRWARAASTAKSRGSTRSPQRRRHACASESAN